MFKLVYSVILISAVLLKITDAAEPLVKLPDGTIRGFQRATESKKNYYGFEKVPFAAPPIKDLRFKSPVPPKPWTGVLNTTSMDVVCYQVPFDMPFENEDCLYLNVYTPQLPTENSTRKSLPVMFYIFGGAFVLGFPSQLVPNYLLEQDVVVVSINYRVGPFGFLSTEDDVIAGNFGLKDQQLALQWTHKNIHLFGGDPKQITIFGVSAGAASVSHQLLNPQNQGLIKGAILISGTAINQWAIKRDAKEIAFNTTAMLNPLFKVSRNSKALLTYLKAVPAKDLDRVSSQYREPGVINPTFAGYNYGPVIEHNQPGAFLTEKMYQSIKRGNFLQVPVMLGLAAEEMLFFYQANQSLHNDLELYDAQPESLVNPGFHIKNRQQLRTVAQSIKNIYLNGTKWSSNPVVGIGFAGDDRFARPIVKYAELASKKVKTYFYLFSYSGPTNAKQYYYDGAERATHGDEFLFLSNLNSTATAEDKLTIQRIVKAYTNFAKFQNPTPENDPIFNNITWPAINGTDFVYLNINKTVEIVRNRPRNSTYAAWVKLYDSLGDENLETY